MSSYGARRRTRTPGAVQKYAPQEPGLDYRDANIGDGLPTNRKTLGDAPRPFSSPTSFSCSPYSSI